MRGEAMSPLTQSNNLAARMGRWSASHWKTAVFGWLALVVGALALAQTIGTKQIPTNDYNVGQARQADHILRDAGFQPDPQTEIVVVQSPYASGREAQISADGRTAMVQWAMKGDNDYATERIAPLMTATDKVAQRHPSFYVGEAGSISSGKALNDAFQSQLAKAGER